MTPVSCFCWSRIKVFFEVSPDHFIGMDFTVGNVIFTDGGKYEVQAVHAGNGVYEIAATNFVEPDFVTFVLVMQTYDDLEDNSCARGTRAPADGQGVCDNTRYSDACLV